MNHIDYRKRLGLSYTDKDKTDYFIAQMYNFFLNVSGDRERFDSLIEQSFCNKIGMPMKKENLLLLQFDNNDEPTGLQRAWIYLEKRQKNLLDFLFCYIMLVNSYAKGRTAERSILINVLLDALDNCQIPYDVIEDEDGIFVFPKGVPEFDDALVSQPLEWLNDYPSAQIAWVKALKDYSDATEETASDVADKFRKALETFFQEFFGGQKSLENYKSDYGKYLKKQGVPKEISGNFETLLQSYTQFINNYAKHKDATSDKVLEYIMYQTGNIIRLLITLRQEEPTDAD